MDYKDAGYINSLEIDKTIVYKGKNLFSNELQKLTWNNMRMLSMITGKNGIGKSKVMKLIRYYLNDKATQMDVKVKFKDNLKSNDIIANLIHFDGNLTDLRNDLYYKKSESTHLETNFTIENSFNYLPNEYNIHFPQYQQSKYRFANILDLLFQFKRELDDGSLNEALKKVELHFKIKTFKKYQFHYNKKNYKFTELEEEKQNEFYSQLVATAEHQGRTESLNTLVENLVDADELFENVSLPKDLLKLVRLYNQKKKTDKEYRNEKLEKVNLDKLVNDLLVSLEENFKELKWFKYDLTSVSGINFQSETSDLELTELTTGEQIMLLSVLWEYKIKNFRNDDENKDKKIILLLDEPDCFLHTSAIKLFVDTIKKKIIGELGVQVIMTTHSPITVSLIDKECLYLMEKFNNEVRIQSFPTKREIFETINENIVFVDEHFKLVFVEGARRDDHKFYSIIYNQLTKNKKPNTPLIFRGLGSNTFKELFNKEKVKIEDPDRHGDREFYRHIFGIIDGDVHINRVEAISYNVPRVATHSKQSLETQISSGTINYNTNLFRLDRYTLENYLYDPINVFFIARHMHKKLVGVGRNEEAAKKFEQKLKSIFKNVNLKSESICTFKEFIEDTKNESEKEKEMTLNIIVDDMANYVAEQAFYYKIKKLFEDNLIGESSILEYVTSSGRSLEEKKEFVESIQSKLNKYLKQIKLSNKRLNRKLCDSLRLIPEYSTNSICEIVVFMESSQPMLKKVEFLRSIKESIECYLNLSSSDAKKFDSLKEHMMIRFGDHELTDEITDAIKTYFQQHANSCRSKKSELCKSIRDIYHSNKITTTDFVQFIMNNDESSSSSNLDNILNMLKTNIETYLEDLVSSWNEIASTSFVDDVDRGGLNRFITNDKISNERKGFVVGAMLREIKTYLERIGHNINNVTCDGGSGGSGGDGRNTCKIDILEKIKYSEFSQSDKMRQDLIDSLTRYLDETERHGKPANIHNYEILTQSKYILNCCFNNKTSCLKSLKNILVEYKSKNSISIVKTNDWETTTTRLDENGVLKVIYKPFLLYFNGKKYMNESKLFEDLFNIYFSQIDGNVNTDLINNKNSSKIIEYVIQNAADGCTFILTKHLRDILFSMFSNFIMPAADQ